MLAFISLFFHLVVEKTKKLNVNEMFFKKYHQAFLQYAIVLRHCKFLLYALFYKKETEIQCRFRGKKILLWIFFSKFLLNKLELFEPLLDIFMLEGYRSFKQRNNLFLFILGKGWVNIYVK